MILGNGINDKACEGWLLWEGITKVAEVLQDGSKEVDSRSNDARLDQSLSPLERFGLLSHAAVEPGGSAGPPLPNGRGREKAPMTVSSTFWAVVQYAFLACTAMRAVIVALATSSSLPPRSVTGASGQSPVEANHQSQPPQPEDPASRRQLASTKRPVVSMKLWSCASKLVELDSSMPWLAGVMSMLRWGALAGPGRVGDNDGVLDR